MSIQTDNKILVCALAAYRGRCAPIGVNHLTRSAARFGIDMTWWGTDRVFHSMWADKYVYLDGCLRSCDWDWCLCVDAADSLFVRSLEDIWQHRVADKVLFAAEKNCFPDGSLVNRYPECPTAYRFVNGGGFFGPREAVLDCFARRPCGHDDNDQGAHTHNFLSGAPMVLDYYCQVFQTLWGCGAEFAGNKNVDTGKNFCIIHANGSATGHPLYQRNIV